MIKFLYLYNQDRKLDKSIISKIGYLFKKEKLILEKEVDLFEKKLNEY